MVTPSETPLLVVLPGPTASGKTALSLALAREFGGEIVSCDSVAVYRELEIGTAKPTLAERSTVPHHMIDVASPSGHYTAGDYSREARAALAGIVERGRLPIVTGGTGLYLRALIDGLFAGPRRSEELRERLHRSAARHGDPWLHRLLARLDPETASRIHANDRPKLIRALEICLETKQPMSRALESGRDRLRGFRVLRIGLHPPRPALYARIDRRAAAMFAIEEHGGLIAETERLIARYGEKCWALQSLGYRQAAEVLRGAVPFDEAVRAAQQGHRNYAKRQLTWFRREPQVHWLEGFGDSPEIRERAIELVKHEL